MSRSLSVNYELERRRREALEKEKAGKEAERLYIKFQNQFELMDGKGYSAYIPRDMDKLKSDLSYIRDLLSKDNPLQAVRLARNVGSYIDTFEVIVNSEISSYERMERLNAEKKRVEAKAFDNNLLEVYYDFISKITDPAVVNVVLADIENVKKDITNNIITSKEEILSKLNDILVSSEEKIAKQKAQLKHDCDKASINSRLELTLENLDEENFQNEEKKNSIKGMINDIKNAMSENAFDLDTINVQMDKVNEELDNEIIAESVRKETVKAIYQQLNNQDFTVENPRRYVENGEDYVRIVAKRPSGKQAICDINNKGNIKYKFDEYEGMACLKDIEKFNVALKEVYSIDLSDERVLWENPDKLSKDEYQAMSEDRRTL